MPPIAVPLDQPLPVDIVGAELKRGAVHNTIAMLASNFIGFFPLLIAWLLGPTVLGIFAVAWATTDIISKIAVFGLDNAITTFIARSEAVGDRVRTRMLFRLAIALAVAQSAACALLVSTAVRLFGPRLGLQSELVSAIAILVWALPGMALYRMSVSVSRGMKVMKHDIFSRGMTEPIATIVAFLIVLGAGGTTFAPELSAIVGTGGSGIVAFTLASKLFMGVPPPHDGVALTDEARKLYAYSAPISAHQLLTALLSKLDVIMLGSFVGRVPGVTLATVGIYSGVLDLAIGLRKVNQSFNPIFAPVVAGMVATGEKESAAATYTRLGQWMLWILLPFVAVMALAAPTILMIYPPSFQQGTMWLGLVAGACAINAFVSLGETAIMVQRPHLNLLHSAITCAISAAVYYLLISRVGVTGAAFGSLVPFVTLGILRSATLRWVFRWNYSWSNILAPAGAAIIALLPALACRLRLQGMAGQISSALLFLALFGGCWKWYRSKTARTFSPRI